MEVKCGPLLFFSNFDSGNLARVELIEEEQQSTLQGEDALKRSFYDLEYNVWTKPDCMNTTFENGNRTWFHFGVRSLPSGKTVKINVMNMNKQCRLYSQGMAPVVRVCSSVKEGPWERLKGRVTYQMVDGNFVMTFTYRFPETRAASVFFAFCYPFSYKECQTALSELQDQHMTRSYVEPLERMIYFHKELLCWSLEKRRIDLLTISSCKGVTKEREDMINGLFPEASTERAHKFNGKKVFFVSSRVHPGETPASFVFNGFLEFILRKDDIRAMALRQLFVFKLVPMLNPDGVYNGFYRTDTRGMNLNRVYSDPDPNLHPSIFAVKKLILYHHQKNDTVQAEPTGADSGTNNFVEGVNACFNTPGLPNQDNEAPPYISNDDFRLSGSDNCDIDGEVRKVQFDLRPCSVGEANGQPFNDIAAAIDDCQGESETNNQREAKYIDNFVPDNSFASLFEQKLALDNDESFEKSTYVTSAINTAETKGCIDDWQSFVRPLGAVDKTASQCRPASVNDGTVPFVVANTCFSLGRRASDGHAMVPSDIGERIDCPKAASIPENAGNVNLVDEGLGSLLKTTELDRDGATCQNSLFEGAFTQSNDECLIKGKATQPGFGIISSGSAVRNRDIGKQECRIPWASNLEYGDKPVYGDKTMNFPRNTSGSRTAIKNNTEESSSNIAYYIDLHGHASKRGCFIYANYFDKIEDQVEALLLPKLMSLNSANFDFEACNFSLKNMLHRDKRDGMSKEGSGRVAVYKEIGLIQSYTLECNYNTGRYTNFLPPPCNDDGTLTPPPHFSFPPKYTPDIYAQVGRAIAISALDMAEQNPFSRVSSSEFHTLKGIKKWLGVYVRSTRGPAQQTKKTGNSKSQEDT
ncbi:cytosolic carboxypeptidase-like protein 5 isoform X2 [Rhopilema esculentum]|eukprot:gene7882-13764_t